MHKTWAVIRREFIERVRTRQFLIGTILGPILMGVLIMAPILLQRNTRVKHLVVLDAGPGPVRRPGGGWRSARPPGTTSRAAPALSGGAGRGR